MKVDVEGLTAERLASLIDVSVVKATTTESDVRGACQTALRHGCAAVSVNPCFTELAAGLLHGSEVGVDVSIAFPFGSATTAAKVFETRDAMSRGGTEIDMVMTISEAKSGHWDYVRDDIRAVVEEAKGTDARCIVKVILENAYLTDDEKVKACLAARAAGADFVKTSTGFANAEIYGATFDDVRLMYETVGGEMGVKAAGGIRSLDRALKMIELGVTRMGLSAAEEIIAGWKARHEN
jgi:deoxyribose-phosphate aldolase